MIEIESLRDSREFLAAILDNINSAVFVVDPEARILGVNNAFEALFRDEEDETLGKLCGNVIGCEHQVAEGVDCGATSHCPGCPIREAIDKAIHQKGVVTKDKMTRFFHIGDGNPLEKHLHFSTRRITVSNQDMVLIILDDVTELEENNRRLMEAAAHDVLTGLRSRRYLMEKLHERIHEFRRYKHPFSLLMLDLDHFKEVNDEFGHVVGDEILRQFAEIAKGCFRETDTVGRYGGEEFLVILGETSSREGGVCAERFRSAVEITEFPHDVDITVSGGLSSGNEDPPKVQIERVDKLLYTAKKSGRNRIASPGIVIGGFRRE